MQVAITYIFHNCFILKFANKTLIFDYPDKKFLNDEIREIVFSNIRKTNLYVFVSHSHIDHFNTEIAKFSEYSRSIKYVISNDIFENYPEFRVKQPFLRVKSIGTYELDDFKIRTIESNDLGVAFIIQWDNTSIYFGGDFANWNWESLDIKSKNTVELFFESTLSNLSKWNIDIAFSDTDNRLKSWAGAIQFIEKIQPRIFIPMHAFGDLDSIKDFANEIKISNTKIFTYEKTGDTILMEIEPKNQD